VVIARLDEVDLHQHVRQRLSMSMLAIMTQEWGGGSEPMSRTCEYEYRSAIMELEDWMLHDGKLFGDTFTDGMENLAQWMARDLDAFATRRAEPEMEGVPATCFQPQDG
jgi:hypothetical protein